MGGSTEVRELAASGKLLPQVAKAGDTPGLPKDLRDIWMQAAKALVSMLRIEQVFVERIDAN